MEDKTEATLEEMMKAENIRMIGFSEVERMKGHLFGIEIDVATTVRLDNIADQFLLEKTCTRGSKFNVVLEHKYKDVLTFQIGVAIPEEYSCFFKSDKIFATTFPDLCWLHAEGTTPTTLEEVMTPLRPNISLGDLTWLLPSKFLDDLIEAIHSLNQVFLDGILGDGIVYGPYTTSLTKN